MKLYKDICEVLNTDPKTLQEVILNKSNYYYSYPIRKKNGKKRYIDAPIGILKKWQEIITKQLLYKYRAHPIAYGFVRNKNPILAAKKHVNKEILVAMDIKNFFNSMTEDNIKNLFIYLFSKNNPWEEKNYLFLEKQAALLAQLLTYKGVVPQGAPSSPVLSNLYMLRPDKLLFSLAKDNKLIVTRYADDIVFSTTDKSKLSPGIIISATKKILRSYDLKLNPNKIHINRKNKRMRVVGIIVNKKTNIPREVWRNFRAQLHNLKISQKPINEKEAQKLRGKIEWYRSLNPARGRQFLQEYGQLNFMNTSDISTPTTI